MENEALNHVAWQLEHIAQALTRAKRLEALRASFHKELYECICYPSVNLDYLSVNKLSTATDSQAIRIIEAKERYDKKIHMEYERYIRWQSLLQMASEHDKKILFSYFQKKKYIRPAVINQLLSRLRKKVEAEEMQIAKERSERAAQELSAQLQANNWKRPARKSISFYENEQWEVVDLQDHEWNQWKKRNEEHEKEWQRLQENVL